MYKLIINFFAFFMLTIGYTQTKLEKVAMPKFKRLYKLNDSVYRSEQPSRKEFKRLEKLGIKTVVNLRRLKDDKRKTKGTNLQLEHIQLKSSELNETHIINALKVLKNTKKPVLIHCWHGSDRTGAIAAAYRIVFENWTKEDAIAELRMPNLKYHENWYPNVVVLLENLNVEKLRKELGLQTIN